MTSGWRSESERHSLSRQGVKSKWYHGTRNWKPILESGILKPGQRTGYHQDLPRDDAVYLTKDLRIAEHYADVDGRIFEVEIDESNIIPDEDVIFDLLNTKQGKLSQQVKEIWYQYRKKISNDLYGAYNLPSDIEPYTQKTSMKELHTMATYAMENPEYTDLSENMKQFAEYLSNNYPKLTKQIIQKRPLVAHIGDVKIKRMVD
jgi:hypothetical protein